MTGFSRTRLAVITAAVMGASAAPAEDMTEVEALKARVAELESLMMLVQSGNQMSEQRADEIRAMVYDVLADADARASLLGDGLSAGWDGGFYLASGDGSFRLRFSGKVQSRFVYNNRDHSSDDHRWGFEVRRSGISFSGHVVDSTWQYKVGTVFGRTTGRLSVEDAWIGKDFGNGWKAKFGRFNLPFMHENLISDTKQLAVSRSLLNGFFSASRSSGIGAEYKTDNFRVSGMISNGEKMGMTSAVGYDTEYAITGRAEWLADGSWSQFGDYTSPNDGDSGLLIGAAVHWQDMEYGTMMPGEIESLKWTVDAHAEFGGASLAVAVVGRHTDGGMSADQYGAVVQGGVHLNDEWELFGRYEWADEDAAGVDDLNILTVGVIRYISGHQLKWTSDVGFAFDAVSDTFDSSGAGWQVDAPGQDGQIVFRTQMQLLF